MVSETSTEKASKIRDVRFKPSQPPFLSKFLGVGSLNLFVRVLVLVKDHECSDGLIF